MTKLSPPQEQIMRAFALHRRQYLSGEWFVHPANYEGGRDRKRGNFERRTLNALIKKGYVACTQGEDDDRYVLTNKGHDYVLDLIKGGIKPMMTHIEVKRQQQAIAAHDAQMQSGNDESDIWLYWQALYIMQKAPFDMDGFLMIPPPAPDEAFKIMRKAGWGFTKWNGYDACEDQWVLEDATVEQMDQWRKGEFNTVLDRNTKLLESPVAHLDPEEDWEELAQYKRSISTLKTVGLWREEWDSKPPSPDVARDSLVEFGLHWDSSTGTWKNKLGSISYF